MDTRLYSKHTIRQMKTYRIGRASGNDIIYSNIEVSNEHADLIEDQGSYTLVDHSRNGTIVNGTQVHNAYCRVRYGDSIVFAGKERFNWELISNRRAGTAPVSTGNYPIGADQKNAPNSVASMVCGIASLVLSVSTIVAIALAIVGLVLGVNGTKKIRGQEQLYKGLGMLKAGKICSIISLCLNGIVLIVIIAAGAAIGLTLFSAASYF